METRGDNTDCPGCAILLGKLFQSKGHALLKALSPKEFHLVFRTARTEVSHHFEGATALQFYKGVSPRKTC